MLNGEKKQRLWEGGLTPQKAEIQSTPEWTEPVIKDQKRIKAIISEIGTKTLRGKNSDRTIRKASIGTVTSASQTTRVKAERGR